jgi:hypothetical protein
MTRLLVAGIMVLALVLTIGTAAGDTGASPLNTTGPAGENSPLSPGDTGADPLGSYPGIHTLPAVDAPDALRESSSPSIAPFSGTSSIVSDGTGEVSVSMDRIKTAAGNLDSASGRKYHNYVYPVKEIMAGTIPAVDFRKDDNIIDMFYFNASRYIYTASAIAGNETEFPWEYMIPGTGTFSKFSMASCSPGPGHIVVFYVNGNNGLYQKEWNGSWQSDDWIDLSGSFDANSTPACVSRGTGNIELAYRNKSGLLIHRSRNGDTWGPADYLYPDFVSNEGVSLVSFASDSFMVVMHYVPDNSSRTIRWNQSTDWDPAWRTSSMPAYSFIGATARDSNAAGTKKYIDTVFDKSGTQTWYWNVSRNGGITWSPEPSTNHGTGTGYLDGSGSPYVVVSPRYNRLEFFQEFSGQIFENVYIIPSNETIGVVRNNNTWLLDKSGNGAFGAGDTTRTFGKAGDVPVAGDWNADGTTEIGVVRGGKIWLLDKSGDGAYGTGDLTYTFGKAGDVPVTGVWDYHQGTGIGVVRNNNTWLLDYTGDGTFSSSDLTYTFGKAGDVPVTGDWNGDWTTEIGVVRGGTTWLLDASSDGKFGGGDLTYTFGKAGDVPVTSDWNADGATEIGVVRNNATWLLDKSANGKFGYGDLTYTFGKAGDKPVAGLW